MKKVAGLCLVVWLSSVSVFAQDNQQKDRRMDRKMDRTERYDRMVSDLNLTQQQAADFRKINESFMQKMRKERDAMEADRKQRREKMETLMNKRNAEMKKILTAEQYQKYLDQQKRMRKKQRRDGDKCGR